MSVGVKVPMQPQQPPPMQPPSQQTPMPTDQFQHPQPPPHPQAYDPYETHSPAANMQPLSLQPGMHLQQSSKTYCLSACTCKNHAKPTTCISLNPMLGLECTSNGTSPFSLILGSHIGIVYKLLGVFKIFDCFFLPTF